jgi:hypothetical protein
MAKVTNMTTKPEDIPLAAIAAFHEVNPLAMNEPYDWPDSTLARVRNALSAAVNVMLADTQDAPPLKEGPLLLAMAARNAERNTKGNVVVTEAWRDRIADALSDAGYSRQADVIRRIEIPDAV